MKSNLFSRLQRTNNHRWWFFAILIAALFSVAIVSVMAVLLKGEVTTDYLLIGLVASTLVAAIVVGMVAYFLNRLMQLQQDNEILNATVAERQHADKVLRDLIYALPDLVWLKSVNGAYMACNPSFERFFGIKEGEIVGKTDYHFMDKALADSFRENERIAMAGARPRVNEEWVTFTKEGRIELLETIKTPLFDAEGLLTGVLGVGHNITERKRAEEALQASEMRFRNLLETIPSVSVQGYGPDGTTHYWNQASERVYGYSAKEAIGRNLLDLIIPFEMRDGVRAAIRQMFETGQPIPPSELSRMRKDGSKIDVFSSHAYVHVPGKEPEIFCVDVDLTERKQAERELRIAATAFESQAGMLVTDSNNVILRVNQAFTQITGYSADEAVGKQPSMLRSGCYDADFYVAIWECVNRIGAWDGEICNRRKNGEIYPEYRTITAVKDQEGKVINYVSTFSDITSNKAAAEEIERLAFYDPLTGLPNRRLLRDRLKSALASSHRNDRTGALLFIDMDNFKTLNDTLGHDMGDLLLQQVAQRLESCVREGCTISRPGGDEFVVILEDLSEKILEAATETEVVGNTILAILNQPYQLSRHEYHSSPSIGATLFSGHRQSIDELLKQADIAMYQAKASGRNALRFFDPQMQACITARVALETDLRLALAENQFVLYFQPQVCHSGRFIGAEALIRWQHPQRGLVPPSDFIPLAEESGLILAIGQWVLETACKQIKSWEACEHNRDLQLAVNVSARQFRQPDFVGQVRQVLSRTAINPDRLKLELTESLLLDDISDTIGKMNALKKVGVRFALDDFGTGHSSLAYLTQLPLDQIKIDQSFIRNIGVNSSDSIIVQTIIGMTKNLGMEIIAEGVETETQRAFLERHDCPVCQGYLFGKPVPLTEFEQLLTRQSNAAVPVVYQSVGVCDAPTQPPRPHIE